MDAVERINDATSTSAAGGAGVENIQIDNQIASTSTTKSLIVTSPQHLKKLNHCENVPRISLILYPLRPVVAQRHEV